MEVNKLYKVSPFDKRGNTHRKCGLLLAGNTVDITIYGSKTRPEAPEDMIDLTNAEAFDAEGAYVLSGLPSFVYFTGTADVIELINYIIISELPFYQTTPDLPMSATDLTDMGYSSESIDARLNYLYSIGTTEQLITIYGNSPRTSASDAAFIGLTTPPLNNTIEE